MNVPLLLIFIAALSVGGCAGFSKDGGFNDVAGATRTHLAKDLKWPRTDAEQAKVAAEVAELLAHPLSVDDAVQIALLNNRGLQASFEELGVSEADLVQSGRLPNPRFDLRHASAAGQYDIEETLSFNVLSLLTLPFTPRHRETALCGDAERHCSVRRALGDGNARGIYCSGRCARVG